MAKASLACGADGIIVEVHNEPQKAMSDGPQALLPEDFEKLMKDIRKIQKALGNEEEESNVA